MAKKKKYEGLAKLLVIIGGLVVIIEAIMAMTGNALVKFDVGTGIVGHVIALILGIVALLSGIKPDDPIPFNGIFLLILGIVMIVLGIVIGGVLVLIGGILLLV
jgi:hypothetical protein